MAWLLFVTVYKSVFTTFSTQKQHCLIDGMSILFQLLTVHMLRHAGRTCSPVCQRRYASFSPKWLQTFCVQAFTYILSRPNIEAKNKPGLRLRLWKSKYMISNYISMTSIFMKGNMVDCLYLLFWWFSRQRSVFAKLVDNFCTGI